jgi:CO/xanthine dehydrogenase Mo-binding subunit
VTNYLKTGVNRDGRIVAREAYTLFDVGAYLGPGPNSGIGHGLGPYNIPNFRLRSFGVYTNKIYVGSYRASGVSDMNFAVESHMDMLAHRLGLDPLEFRLRNIIKEGDTAVNGSRIPRNGLLECIQAVKDRLGLPKKLEAGHGVGIALAEWRSGTGPSTASISVNDDGTVSLLTGSVDISGSDTSLAAIAAETLGIPLERVIVARRDTDLAPFTGPSGGSRIVFSQGKAVQQAAEDTRRKLFALAAERLGVPEDALAAADGRVYVQDNEPQGLTFGQLAGMSLSSRSGPIIGMAALSTMPYTPVFAAQAAEVLVDRATGQVKVTRYVQAQDVGVAINPMAVEGQLEGGAVQGIGRALTEDLRFDPNTGRVRNPSLASYLMPLALDLPELETILVRVPSEDGPFGARAVAEPPGFGPPAAIANAVYDAVGVRIQELPLSGERVLSALQGQPAPEIDLDVDSLRRLEGLAG